MNVFRAEAGEDAFHEGKGSGGKATVRDEDEGLTFGVDGGAMEGVDRDDGDVGREVGFEGGNFGGFGRGLAGDDGALFRCCGAGVSMVIVMVYKND